ncbi:MAG: hypothetical protein WCO60_18340 [Verrucomicrobiota bacterium]
MATTQELQAAKESEKAAAAELVRAKLEAMKHPAGSLDPRFPFRVIPFPHADLDSDPEASGLGG